MKTTHPLLSILLFNVNYTLDSFHPDISWERHHKLFKFKLHFTSRLETDPEIFVSFLSTILLFIAVSYAYEEKLHFKNSGRWHFAGDISPPFLPHPRLIDVPQSCRRTSFHFYNDIFTVIFLPSHEKSFESNTSSCFSPSRIIFLHNYLPYMYTDTQFLFVAIMNFLNQLHDFYFYSNPLWSRKRPKQLLPVIYNVP